MTLGEFREITDPYADNTPISFSVEGYGGVSTPYLVERIVIDIASATDKEPKPVPNIVLI